METIRLAVLAVAAVGAGCAATILSARVFPLWIRVRGQAHGRFAGLVATEARFERGLNSKVGARATPLQKSPNRGLSLHNID
jgi:hypothetical protein